MPFENIHSPAFEFLFAKNIYHVYVVSLNTSTFVLLSPNLHPHLQLYKVSDLRSPMFSLKKLGFRL